MTDVMKRQDKVAKPPVATRKVSGDPGRGDVEYIERATGTEELACKAGQT
jgi:hypothetical protein